jgi:glutaconate CoA-transferase subunit A
VVHAPGGAHPTTNGPDYGWDLDHMKQYNASATEEGGWQKYHDTFVAVSDADYLAKVGGMDKVSKLKLPVF